MSQSSFANEILTFYKGRFAILCLMCPKNQTFSGPWPWLWWVVQLTLHMSKRQYLRFAFYFLIGSS